jgi:hypothetical protein
MFSMSAPLGDFGCVRTPLSAVWGTRPFATTHRQPDPARLTGAFLPRAPDAAPTSRSGFAGRAVGGVFLGAVHGRSVQANSMRINHKFSGAMQ